METFDKIAFNIFNVSLMYARRGFEFLFFENDVTDYNLMVDIFTYSLKKLWGLSTIEVNMETWFYGDSLKAELREVFPPPKKITTIKYKDRVDLVKASVGYLTAICVSMKKRIEEGELIGEDEDGWKFSKKL